MTLAEKILAAHSGRSSVSPGEFISVKADLVLSNDITAPIAIKEFERLGVEKVFDPKKIVMVPDHFCPNKDIQSAEQAKMMREFARKHKLVYFEVGQMGIEHVILPEKGLVLPGDTCSRGRFAYLHLRSAGRLRHRHGLHRYRSRHGYRRDLDEGAADYQDSSLTASWANGWAART